MKPYEMPISTFFNKIIMIRDRIRVLEQKVNASNINEEEKIAIQQYITRSYGSLTSFNILFKNKSDSFVGESSKD
jgi:superoxide dismutase